jgi:hypothetical protein
MKTVRGIALAAGSMVALSTFALVGCEKSPETPAKPAGAATPAPAKPAAGHDHDHGHDHDDHGPATALGEQTAGGFTIKASRDGALNPGSEAPIDVWVTGATKPVAIRLWIGTQDAKGASKAKAEAEGDHWHAHAEVPKPLTTDSKLWIEVENDKGEKSSAGFDLKR